MLGWVLKRGLEGGRDAMDGPDDTQLDQPDTPGPVFAARAFKSALFGTPAPPEADSNNDGRQRAGDNAEAAPPVRRSAVTADGKTDAKDTTPPRRLAGILLTPGTGTTRRKRVSFGHDVGQAQAGDNQPALDKQKNERLQKKEFRVDRNNRQNSLFGEPARAGSTPTSDSDRNRTRSKLSEALENARKASSRPLKTEKEEQKPAQGQEKQQQQQPDTLSGREATDPAGDDGVWEEVEEEDDNDGEWDPDVTVDLNEPHSQSGRFWKAQFQRYQEDAKVEMSRLLKYKQLAKSYAKMKDAEAKDMQAKLREEKHKVVQMEDRITELADQVARKRMKGSNRDYQELISDLTRQTALAVQYRNQVKELEAMLQDDDGHDVADEDSVLTARSRRLQRQAVAGAGTTAATAVSPRTRHTLHETQRELRRAREQVRELTQARDEARRLRTALRAAETRALQSEREAKGLRAELAAAQVAAQAATAQAQDQAQRAQFAEDTRRRTDGELRRLQRKYDALKDDAKARVGEAEQVLRRKNEEISQWKKMATAAHKGAEAADAGDAAVVPAALGAKAGSGDDRLASKTTAASAPPAGLAALEKLTRTRYEALSRRRQSNGTAGRTVHGGGLATAATAGDDDFAIRLGNVHFEPDDEPVAAREPNLPQQKKRVLDPKRQTAATQGEAVGSFRILEDDEDDDDAPLLRQHVPRPQVAEPLRTIVEPQRPRTSTAAVAAKAAATADAMDVSRCSLASERAAAAVARIEKRRAERKQKLDQLRNKENMQPA